MRIHCAYCGKPFEKDIQPPFGAVQCPHCSASFDLATKETLPSEEGAAPAAEGLPLQKVGGYRLVREIGRGGMGVVYEGVQESLDRRVAVKVLFRETCKDPQFVARFEREAESLARLNHPHIVTILDRGCEDGLWYFVMEYVDGISLRAMMDAGPVEPRQALAIIPALCDALEYAHGQGVIHRDIKPENILVDRQGRVKIADFGLSRILGDGGRGTRITRSRMVMGTPDYMAPEQREDAKQVDHRADIFSLGVVFYEMLTGDLPIGRFPPPSARDVRIDVRLDEIVLKVLDRDPSRRYQKASDIATDLQRIAAPGAGNAGAAPGAPSREPARGWFRAALEAAEDGWDSWVLAVAITLTVVYFPFPGVLAFVGWLLLRKSVRRRRDARLAAGRAPRPAPAAPPRPPAPAAPAPPPAPNPPAPPARPAPPVLVPGPRTSFLAVLSAVFGVGLLLAFPLFLPFQGEVSRAFLSLPLEAMPVVLAVAASVALPGVFVLLLAVVARTRVAVNPHLGGSFLALLGIAGSVIFLGVAARQWFETLSVYRSFATLKESLRRGDPGSADALKRCAEDPDTRHLAFEIARSAPPSAAREFFAGAAGGEGEEGLRALREWAGACPNDPASRLEILKRVEEILAHPGRSAEEKAAAVRALARLPGRDARPVLARASADASPRVREEAARVLEEWEDPDLGEAVLALALDRDRDVAERAFEALREMERAARPGEAAALYARLFRDCPHPEVQRRALQRLEAEARRAKTLPAEALAALEEGIGKAEAPLAEAAARLAAAARNAAGRAAAGAGERR